MNYSLYYQLGWQWNFIKFIYGQFSSYKFYHEQSHNKYIKMPQKLVQNQNDYKLIIFICKLYGVKVFKPF